MKFGLATAILAAVAFALIMDERVQYQLIRLLGEEGS